MTQEELQQSFERMRLRRKARAVRVPPDVPCSKCKAHAWEPDYEGTADDWYCFRCGNRGYWVDGEFKQTYKG